VREAFSNSGPRGAHPFGLSVKKHDTSKVHVQSTKAAEAIKSTPENRPIDKGIRMMNTKAFDRLSILFRSVHAIAKQWRPFTDLHGSAN
jgi:hypothetical protein